MPRRAHHLLVALAAVTALAASTTGCSDDGGGAASGTSTTSSSVAPTTSLPVATTRATAAAGQPYTVWFLRDGRLSPGEARIAATDDPAREAVEALIAGRTEVEEALGLQTGVQSNVTIQSWEQQGTTVVVGFNRALETAQTRPQVAQIVWTLTQFPGIDAVQFLIDGRPNGATGVPPIDRFEVDEVAPPVLVDGPLPAAVLGPTTAITVDGTTAPGAAVGWRLVDGFGTPLAEGGADEVAAEPGPDGRTAWRSTVPVPEGTAGAVRLIVWDASTGVEAFPQEIPLTVGDAPGP